MFSRLGMMAALAGCAACGQSLAAPVFEVASVKASATGTGAWSVSRGDGGRFVAENAPLKGLIEFAYDIRDQQMIGAPGWTGTARYNIEAKPDRTIPVGPDGDATIKLMVRDLLADRFRFLMHRENRTMPIYALVVARNGPKLTESGPGSKGPDVWVSRGQFRASKARMADLAVMLSNQVGRTVMDKTGLTGDYDFKVEYAPDAGQTGAAPASDAPTIFTALQEQLGLRLESQNEPVELLVIDRVEMPSAN